jgi:hypothetical protein
MTDDPDPPRRHYQLKPREFERVNDRPGDQAPGAAPRPIDVRDHLRAADGARAAQPPSPRPRRRSRRTRDYWLALIGVDAALAFAAFGPWANGATRAFGIAGLIVFTLGLTWAMWFVADDY